MELREISPSVFEEYSFHHPYITFYQSVAFTELKRKEGWEVYYLGGFEQDTLCGCTAIICSDMFAKYKYCCAIKGFLIDYSDAKVVKEFTDGVVSFLKRRGGLYLRINPAFLYQEHDIHGAIVEDGFHHQDYVNHLLHTGFVHEGFNQGVYIDQHVRWTFVLPLNGEDEASLKKNMSKLTLRNLKNVDKFHVRVHEINKVKDLSIFTNIMKHTANRRDFDVFDETYYKEQFEAFHSNGMMKFLYAEFYVKEYLDDIKEQIIKSKAKIGTYEQQGDEANEKTLRKLALEKEMLCILERKETELTKIHKEHGDSFPISSANFMLYSNEVIYFNGGSYDEYMHYCGQFAIQWYMIRYALEHQIDRFNFNGLTGNFHEDAEDYGVYTFKKGFGGHVEEYVGYFHMPLRKGVYQLSRIVNKCKRLLKKGDL